MLNPPLLYTRKSFLVLNIFMINTPLSENPSLPPPPTLPLFLVFFATAGFVLPVYMCLLSFFVLPVLPVTFLPSAVLHLPLLPSIPFIPLFHSLSV